MYKTIMVPTDGTGFDREAIRVALRLATKTDASIHLVRVLKESALIVAGAGSDGLAMVTESLTIARDRELKDLYMLAAECRDTTSATIITALEEGPVSSVLEAYATRVSPELIVISSRGRHGIARLSLGSVTDGLIRKSHIPVLVVKGKDNYLNPRAVERFKQIVIPLDGSTLAEQIIDPAIDLARLENAEIVLLQVLSSTEGASEESSETRAWWEDQLPTAHAYLNRVAGRIRKADVRVTSDIVIGNDVPEAIATFARSRRAELIAIATHGRSGLQRAIRGSVADELTRTAGITLLVLRPFNKVENVNLAEVTIGEPTPVLLQ